MENKHIKIAEQEAVLNETKSQIVSASAGSGKTTVMIRKILKILLDKECHVDELLVLTYTKSAAMEMKKKLVEKLKENIQKDSSLQDELELVQSSDISTFDSFCQKLVKKYFYILDIDPSFKLLDSGEQAYQQGVALDLALADLKNEFPQEYEDLLNNFSSSRNEQNIKSLVMEIYTYLTSVFDAEKFWQTTLNMYEQNLKIAENELIKHYDSAFCRIKNKLNELLPLSVEYGFEKYSEYINMLNSCLDSVLLETNFGKKVEYINQLSIKALYKIKLDKIDFKDRIAECKSEFSKYCDEIKNEYVDSKNIEKSYEKCKILIKNIQKLVNLFEMYYFQTKRSLNMYDFNDIERMSIKLLENPQINNDIKHSYKKIFVDEFQDANRVQEQIINLLDNNNLFFVGDTKQSIYAFRQSEPQIFLDIEKRFSLSDNAEANTLNSNFRTNKNILYFVNKIFNVLMTEGSCGINYQKDAQFDPRAEYKDVEKEVCVSCDLLINNWEDAESKPMEKIYSVKENALQSEVSKANDYESAYICQKIVELLGQDIYDRETDKFRKINFSDITILLAKRGSGLKSLLTALKEVGIPYVVNVNNNLEECYDNQVMYNLLRLVLNSQDDYALYSVLSSALFGFGDNELATIKLNQLEEKCFYSCLELYATQDNDLANKIKDFYQTLSEFGFDVKHKGIYYALNKIIKSKNYLLNIQEQEGYAERKLNLLAYINSFAGSKFDLNICEYVLYRETSVRQEKVQTDKSFAEAVEITTMHSSKGLEYPVVILPFLNQDYTKQASRGFGQNNSGGLASTGIKINKELGIGIKNYDADERSVSGGIFYNACKIKNKEIEISEKIRLLYVAMTRAKSKLILTGVSKSNYKSIVDDADIFSKNNYLSLIVGAMPQEIIDKINNNEEFSCELCNNEKNKLSLVDVQLKQIERPQQSFVKISNSNNIVEISNFLKKDLAQKASNIALKNSVSEFAFDDDANLTFAPVNFSVSEHLSQKASDVGTLYHKLLQICDFDQIKQIDDVKVFVECNFNAEEILIFKQIGYNNIFSNICNIKNNIPKDSVILKEQKFVMRVKHSEIVDGGEDCYILVQGIIDLLVISDNQVILIDYKHSRKTDEEIKRTYSKQLDLYALAISKRFKKQSLKRIIFNIHKNTVIYL